MGKGYKHGGSGGANPLNFTVKTYPSEVELKADKPKENTIGVITTTTMTKWVFSATEPKEPEVGMVWFLVDKESSVEFNALKKNTLQVYPTSAKQYINSKFEDKTSFTYQDAKWTEWWNGKLFDNGNQFEAITGGWARNSNIYFAYSGKNTGDITIDDTIQISAGANVCSVVTTVNKIDLTEFKTLNISIATASIFQVAVHDFASGDIEKNYSAGYKQEDTTATSSDLDISALNGKYYISIATWNGRGAYIDEIKLLK